jgi:ectoine hydroxylase-related dioxygenase (phytanoyl-CoA dioxygenase family)
VKGIFTREEMGIVKKKVMSTQEMNDRVKTVQAQQQDGQHPSFNTIFVWNDVDGSDIFAKMAKSPHILDRLSFYYDNDVYAFHNKIALKYPGIAGFNPHQDYFYWGQMGVRFPEAHAAWIAIDPATKENGCLQVVPRSHMLGTVPHDTWGRGEKDFGVNKGSWAGILETGYTPVHMEMDPGDVIFFHGNTIHLSADNNSSKSRISMIATMNTKATSPLPGAKTGHPYWTPQKRMHLD